MLYTKLTPLALLLILSLYTFNASSQDLEVLAEQDSKQAEFEKIMQQQPLIVKEYFEKVDSFMGNNRKILIQLSNKLDRCDYQSKQCPKFEIKVHKFNEKNQNELNELRYIASELEESLWQMQILLRDEKIRDDNRATLASYNKEMLNFIQYYDETLTKNYGKGQKFLYEAIHY